MLSNQELNSHKPKIIPIPSAKQLSRHLLHHPVMPCNVSISQLKRNRPIATLKINFGHTCALDKNKKV